MKFKKAILTTLVLAVMGLFLAGCGGGECPFKKIFGGGKSAETKQPCPAESTQ
jgi:hypothetical protein